MNPFRLFSFLRRQRRPQPATRRPRRRVRLGFEMLEDRRLPCAVISGYVYHDANNNGLYDPGESALAGSTLELLNSQGVVVASAVTGRDGSYQFTTDSTIPTSDQTISNTINFSNQTTNWTRSGSVPKFDPSLGTLTEVDIINSSTLTGDIKVENL